MKVLKMRKLLFQISLLCIAILGGSCHSTRNNDDSKTTGNSPKIANNRDSSVSITDTIILDPDASAHSSAQKTEVNQKNDSIEVPSNKTTVRRRVEHGSENQNKLDSIKKVKVKLKTL